MGLESVSCLKFSFWEEGLFTVGCCAICHTGFRDCNQRFVVRYFCDGVMVWNCGRERLQVDCLKSASLQWIPVNL